MKKILISIILTISIIGAFVIVISINNNEINYNQIFEDKNEKDEKNDLYETRKAITNFVNSRNIVLAKVNGKEITEKRLCITKYYYQDSENLLAQEIENTVLTELAKENNLEISDKDTKWTNEVMDGLKECILNSDIEYDTDEFMKLLREASDDISLRFEYIRFLRDKIENGTLEIKDDNLKEEYESFLEKYNKWQETKPILEYPKILRTEDTIIQKYIEYQISQADIEINKNLQ